MIVDGRIGLHITPPYHHHYADRSESIELLKSLSGTSCLECVSKIQSILSIIFHAIYGAVRIQLTHFSHDDCENTCTYSYYHHQIGRMANSPLFRVRSWNTDIRCMSFYILIVVINSCIWSMDHPIIYQYNWWTVGLLYVRWTTGISLVNIFDLLESVYDFTFKCLSRIHNMLHEICTLFCCYYTMYPQWIHAIQLFIFVRASPLAPLPVK